MTHCELCGASTTMTGTKRCDRCWEIEKRVKADPEIAAAVLENSASSLCITEIRTADDGTVYLRTVAGHWYAVHRSDQYSSIVIAEDVPPVSPHVHGTTAETILRQKMPQAF